MTCLPGGVGLCDEMLSYRKRVKQRALELSGPFSNTQSAHARWCLAWRVVNHLSFADPLWLSIAELVSFFFFFLYEEGGKKKKALLFQS